MRVGPVKEIPYKELGRVVYQVKALKTRQGTILQVSSEELYSKRTLPFLKAVMLGWGLQHLDQLTFNLRFQAFKF